MTDSERNAEVHGAFQSVHVDHLQLGLYVKLNCSWFRHPFLSNSFKVRSQSEIAIIREMGIEEINYDPGRSDPDALEALAAEILKTRRTEAARVASRNPPVITPRKPAAPMPAKPRMSQEQIRTSLDCQNRLKRAGTTYLEAGRKSADVLKDAGSGREEAVLSGTQMIGSLMGLLGNDATSMAMINLLNFKSLSQSNTLHALHICLLSMMVGRDLELSDEEMAKLGMGALFHDVGEQKVPPQVLFKKPGQLTRAERNFLQRHPQFGHDLVTQIPSFPTASAEVILQHHERLDGSGYPNGLKDGDISFLSKIVMAVDEYDELINNADASQNFTPTEALSHLYVNRQGRLSIEAIIALIHTLSVYPPGTLVELSDKSTGIVVGLNLEARVRPTVIVYDPQVPADTPRVINFAEDDSRSIVRSLRPHDIEPEIVDYLNPRRMAGYFITHSIDALKKRSPAPQA